MVGLIQDMQTRQHVGVIVAIEVALGDTMTRFPFTSLKWLFAIMLALALVACGGSSGGGGSTEQSPDDQGEEDVAEGVEDDTAPTAATHPHQTYAGADVQAYRLSEVGTCALAESDSPTVIDSVDAASVEDPSSYLHGRFSIDLNGVDDDEWVVVTAVDGKRPEDPNDQSSDVEALRVAGPVYAIAQARDWRNSELEVSPLTDMTCMKVHQAVLQGESVSDVAEEIIEETNDEWRTENSDEHTDATTDTHSATSQSEPEDDATGEEGAADSLIRRHYSAALETGASIDSRMSIITLMQSALAGEAYSEGDGHATYTHETESDAIVSMRMSDIQGVDGSNEERIGVSRMSSSGVSMQARVSAHEAGGLSYRARFDAAGSELVIAFVTDADILSSTSREHFESVIADMTPRIKRAKDGGTEYVEIDFPTDLLPLWNSSRISVSLDGDEYQNGSRTLWLIEENPIIGWHFEEPPMDPEDIEYELPDGVEEGAVILERQPKFVQGSNLKVATAGFFSACEYVEDGSWAPIGRMADVDGGSFHGPDTWASSQPYLICIKHDELPLETTFDESPSQGRDVGNVLFQLWPEEVGSSVLPPLREWGGDRYPTDVVVSVPGISFGVQTHLGSEPGGDGWACLFSRDANARVGDCAFNEDLAFWVRPFPHDQEKTRAVNVSFEGDGAGTVEVQQDGETVKSCSQECTATVSINAEVQIEAIPANGSEHVGWTGACDVSGSGKCTLTAHPESLFKVDDVTVVLTRFEVPYRFQATSSRVDHGGDYAGECHTEFGVHSKVADWNSIKQLSDQGDALDDLRLILEGNGSHWVSRNGDHQFTYSRDYLMAYHGGELPSGWDAYDDINDYEYSLGSWNSPRNVLCYFP